MKNKLKEAKFDLVALKDRILKGKPKHRSILYKTLRNLEDPMNNLLIKGKKLKTLARIL